MLKEDELNYIESEIKVLISKIENTYAYEQLEYEQEPGREEHPGFTKVWLRDRIKDLYYLILVYLEAKGLKVFLQNFLERYDGQIHNADDDLMESITLHPDFEPELKIIVDFKRVLDPFKVFDYSYTREEELKRLISILKHTDYILKRGNHVVKNETDIYEQVKWVLGLYYPKCRRKNKASFIQEFKKYDPDILIPELKTAIEYKYIRNRKSNIDDYIDQIRNDAGNYTDDHRYENFIAVIYMENSALATEDAIQVAWEQKKFPSNWQLVIAHG